MLTISSMNNNTNNSNSVDKRPKDATKVKSIVGGCNIHDGGTYDVFFGVL